MKLIHRLGVAALIAASMSTVSKAQFYAGINAGYNLSTANSVLGTSTTGTGTTVENMYGTSGPGINAGINVGYMLSEHFGFDLGAVYYAGSPVTVAKADINATQSGATQTKKTTATATTSQIRLIPSFIVSAGGDGIKPYARFGLVVPVSGETVVAYNDEVVNTILTVASTTTEASKRTINGDMSIGFNSALGVNVGLGDKMSIFGEVALNTLSIKAKGATLTEYSRKSGSSETKLSDLKAYQTQVNYVDKLDSSSNNASYNSNYSVDKAMDALATTANYNTIGLNVGIRYKF